MTIFSGPHDNFGNGVLFKQLFHTRFDSEMHEDEEEEEAGQVGEQQVLYFLSVSTAT